MKNRSLSTITLLLLITLTLSFEALWPASAQTATPTPTGTPDDPGATLVVDLGDLFSPDLIAGASIGTSGNRPFLTCSMSITNGALDFNDDPQFVSSIPDFRVQLPSICSDAEIKSSDVRIYDPNGNLTPAALYTYFDENFGETTYVAALPLRAPLMAGDWRISLISPIQADLHITMPGITNTIFFRGALTTGLLAGFQPNERVRGFVFDQIGKGEDWKFSKSFEISVNQYGYRFIAFAALQTSSIVFIGQQGSVYISDSAFTDNGINLDPRQVSPSVIQRVWSDAPGASHPSERTDAHGVVQVYVPQGCFTMGSDSLSDLSNQIRGHSARTVCITHDFWIDKYEVSNAQWEQYRQETGSPLANLDNYATSPQSDTPRVGMTLQQAEAYAQWRGGSIPTEAEWEYAARGPNSPLYPWGDTFNYQANVYGMMGRTVSVTSYPEGASWVGALNMAGNAGEWVADCYSANYDDQLVTYDPVGPCNGSNELVKGSSFAFNNLPAQSAYRFVNPPNRYWFDVGLRVISIDNAVG